MPANPPKIAAAAKAPEPKLETKPDCAVCALKLILEPTPTKKFFACVNCGCPYWVAGAEPRCAFYAEWVEPMNRYWTETLANVAPGAGHLAKSEKNLADLRLLTAWLVKNRASIPNSFSGWPTGFHDLRFAPES